MSARRLIGWVALAMTLISLAALVSLTVGIRRAEMERAERATARRAAAARWDAAGLERYTLLVEENGCRYTVQVRGTLAMIDGRQLHCTTQPSAIDGLFDLLALDGRVERLCDQRGCPCESLISARGEYQPQLGYPQRVLLDVELRPAWLTPDLWQHLLADGGMPPCISHTITDIRVLELTIDDGE